MLDRETTIHLLPHQWTFLRAREKFVLLLGGVGSGKTFAGAQWVINKILTDGGGLGLICANTYKQLQNSTLACLFRRLDEMHIPYAYKEHKGILTIFKSKLLTLSLESYDYIRGVEISYFWADETRDTCLEAFQVLLGRLRDRKSFQKGVLTSSPNGYDWMYDYFEGEKKTKEFRVIKASSRDNTYLPEGYIETLEAAYDPKMIEQEIQGKFVNISSGKVYYAFDRNRHVKECLDGNLIRSGCDFNVDPLTSAIGYYQENKIYITHEFYKRNSNTFEMADSLLKQFGPVEIWPDSTGSSRHTSASESDHEILRRAGHKVQYNPNPHIRDRINTLNGLFSHDRIIIHPRCVMLIKDLEQLSWENKDPMLSHISDALGYLAYGLCPIQRFRNPSRQFNI